MDIKCHLISQSTDIDWRKIDNSPFQEFKVQKKIKRKRPRANTFFIQKQYDNLAEQSIKKSYQITNLTPYNSHPEVKKIRTQISELTTVSPTRNLSPLQKSTLKDKMCKLASQYRLKQLTIQKQNKAKFIKSLITNRERQLLEEYYFDEKQDQKQKEDLIGKINQKLKIEYGQKLQEQKVRKRKIKKKILGFRKTINPVTSKYSQQKNPYSLKKQKKCLMFEKDDIAVYSRSKDKLFSYQKTVSQPYFEGRKFKTKSDKQFYKTYFKSYGERKEILRSCKPI